MPGFLRQATASQSRAIGPFVDSTDFLTPKTGLTIANTDIKLIVNGAASANKNSGGGTHRANGVYGVTFDATDTGTVGEVEVSVVVSGALPVFDKFTVIEEAVYDSLFAAAADNNAAALTAIDDFVDTEVAAIKAKTDLIPASPAAVGDIPTATATADALLDRTNAVETGLTVRQSLRLVLAALAGKASGLDVHAPVYRNAVADSKNRISATTDTSGNRSAVTVDVS